VSDPHRQWLRTAVSHLKQLKSLHAELQDMDLQWPELERAAEQASATNIGRIPNEMQALLNYLRRAEVLGNRVQRLQTRMQRHLACVP
jgi:hypothetical protein